MAKQIDYPADTVDAAGKVWHTIGENIRHGNNIDINEISTAIANIMFPVGSIIIGQANGLTECNQVWAPLPYNTQFVGFVYNAGTSLSFAFDACIPIFNENEKDEFKKVFPNIELGAGYLSTSVITRVL